MAIIYFNGKSFKIPEAALGVASGALRNHLSSVMNGTGATVNFGGTAYGIDSTKLATATNAFVSHLGTVAGNGYKVKVGGVEYGIDSAKMAGAVAEIEAVLAGLISGNDELAAGLYQNGVMTKSWDELVDEGIIIVEDSTISSCADKTIAGDLIAPNSITTIESSAFYNRTALTSVSLPAVESIRIDAFYECTALTSVDLPAATSIETNAFWNCANLSALILRNAETVCNIIVTAVCGTKIATAEGEPTGEGFIYVPSALYEGYVELIAYQAAQLVGDAATAEYIARAVLRKIEDYPEICDPDSGNTPTEERLEGDGQEFHKFAPAALTFRSTAPLNELREVQINGVTVDPSNYTLEEGSTVVTLPIEYLKTLDVDNYEITVVSDSKSAKGGFTVVQPELNEYGFYYNQPYVGWVSGYGDVALIYRENGVLDFIIVDDIYVETGTYTVEGNIIINHVSMGSISATVSSNGAEIRCDALGTAFVLGDESIMADNDYIYSYNNGYMYYGVNYEGYDVLSVIDKNKSSYSPIRTGINGMPTVNMSGDLFYNCANMVVAPEIPDTMLTITDGFHNCTKLESITIPSTIRKVNAYAFIDCVALTNIIFEGTTAQWNAVSNGNWGEYNIPATCVQCSDGQVSLV